MGQRHARSSDRPNACHGTRYAFVTRRISLARGRMSKVVADESTIKRSSVIHPYLVTHISIVIRVGDNKHSPFFAKLLGACCSLRSERSTVAKASFLHHFCRGDSRNFAKRRNGGRKKRAAALSRCDKCKCKCKCKICAFHASGYASSMRRNVNALKISVQFEEIRGSTRPSGPSPSVRGATW